MEFKSVLIILVCLCYAKSQQMSRAKVAYICRATQRANGVEIHQCKDWYGGNWAKFRGGEHLGMCGSENFIIIFGTESEYDGLHRMKDKLWEEIKKEKETKTQRERGIEDRRREEKRKLLAETFKTYESYPEPDFHAE